MAKPKVEIQISDLQKSIQKQLVETIKGKQSASKTAKSKQIVVDVRAKSKSEVV